MKFGTYKDVLWVVRYDLNMSNENLLVIASDPQSALTKARKFMKRAGRRGKITQIDKHGIIDVF